jgi:tetratricopeptide (TPR) repeat protein
MPSVSPRTVKRQSRKLVPDLDFFTPLDENCIEPMPKKVAAKSKLSRREQRELDIEICFFEGLVRRAPAYVDALQILGDNYTRRGKFVDGLKVDEHLSKLRPDDPLVLYNLACSYALTKRYEQAVAALIRAIDRGYQDFRWIAKDPDLKGLRKHKLFKKVESKIHSAKIKIQ